MINQGSSNSPIGDIKGLGGREDEENKGGWAACEVDATGCTCKSREAFCDVGEGGDAGSTIVGGRSDCLDTTLDVIKLRKRRP